METKKETQQRKKRCMHRLTFEDGVWLVHRMYEKKLTEIWKTHEGDAAAGAIEQELLFGDFKDKILNNILIDGYLEERADHLMGQFGIDL